MRVATDKQNKLAERILKEFEKSGLRLFEDSIRFIEGSSQEEICRFLRAEGPFQIYIYEDGEADVNGPQKRQHFELPDFDFPQEMEDAVIEEVILQARPGEIDGVLFKKREFRRRRSQIRVIVFLVFCICGFVFLRFKIGI